MSILENITAKQSSLACHKVLKSEMVRTNFLNYTFCLDINQGIKIKKGNDTNNTKLDKQMNGRRAKIPAKILLHYCQARKLQTKYSMCLPNIKKIKQLI